MGIGRQQHIRGRCRQQTFLRQPRIQPLIERLLPLGEWIALPHLIGSECADVILSLAGEPVRHTMQQHAALDHAFQRRHTPEVLTDHPRQINVPLRQRRRNTLGEHLKLLGRQGLEFQLGCRVTAARVKGRKCVVECEHSAPLECDRVLLAVGRVPCTDDLGLETVGVTVDERGRIPVDEQFATSAPGVYAIGDVIRGPMLAHKAEEEGVACVERIFTGYGHVNYETIPGVCYTEPEIAGVGRTEEQLKSEGRAYRKGVFHFRGNGRARALGQVDGRVKILADARTDRILGVHIIGPRAGDLIAEAAVAMEFGASSEDLARCTHAHPTLAECLKEAALAVDGRALHA